MSATNPIAAGATLHLGPVTVDREAVLEFARDYDPQRFHLSDEGARDTYFGRLSASGWHTVAIALDLLAGADAWPLAGLAMREIRALRWRTPVYPDDRLSARVVVLERDAEGALRLAVTLDNQHESTVAGFELTLGR